MYIIDDQKFAGFPSMRTITPRCFR